MGSLMAGWSTHLDPEAARLERNRSSLTREEIESFWKRSNTLQGIKSSDAAHGSGDKKPTDRQQLERSKTFPGGGGGGGAADDESGKEKKKAGAWWTRSNWAFLNEPPQDDLSDSSRKYAPQFHVAEIAAAAAAAAAKDAVA